MTKYNVRAPFVGTNVRDRTRQIEISRGNSLMLYVMYENENDLMTHEIKLMVDKAIEAYGKPLHPDVDISFSDDAMIIKDSTRRLV